nr:hypothetical protein [Tanacetum cinerariifolium]
RRHHHLHDHLRRDAAALQTYWYEPDDPGHRVDAVVEHHERHDPLGRSCDASHCSTGTGCR